MVLPLGRGCCWVLTVWKLTCRVRMEDGMKGGGVVEFVDWRTAAKRLFFLSWLLTRHWSWWISSFYGRCLDSITFAFPSLPLCVRMYVFFKLLLILTGWFKLVLTCGHGWQKKVKTMKCPAAWKRSIFFHLNESGFCSTRCNIALFSHPRINRSFQQAAKLVPEADGGIPERQSDGPDYVLEERLGTVCPDWPIQAGPHVSVRSVTAKGNKLGYTQTLGYDSLRIGFVGLLVWMHLWKMS